MKHLNIYLFILLLLSLSCKENQRKENITLKSDSSLSNSVIAKKEDECFNNLKALILTSSLKNPFKKALNIKIDKKENTMLRLRLFVVDSLGVNKENTIGWIIFNAKRKILLDITNDIENPEILSYDSCFWNKAIVCYFNSNKDFFVKGKIKDNSLKKSCIDLFVESGLGEECIYSNTNIEDIYKNIIDNQEIENSSNLLKILPQNNVTINIERNNDGLISIKYRVSQNEVFITFFYEGGTNEIIIKYLDKNKIKRNIYHYAD